MNICCNIKPICLELNDIFHNFAFEQDKSHVCQQKFGRSKEQN